jgi:hypothetical protein
MAKRVPKFEQEIHSSNFCFFFLFVPDFGCPELERQKSLSQT